MPPPGIEPASPELRAKFDAYATRKGRKRAYRAVFLRSRYWRVLRRAVLVRDRRRCQCCRTRTHLDVHHVSYVRMWEGDIVDLMVLCRFCHAEVHRRGLQREPGVRLWKICFLKDRPRWADIPYYEPSRAPVPEPPVVKTKKKKKRRVHRKQFAPGYSPTAPVIGVRSVPRGRTR